MCVDTMAVAVKCLVIFHKIGVKERVTLNDEENDSNTNETHPVTTTTTVGKEKLLTWGGLARLSEQKASAPPGSFAAMCSLQIYMESEEEHSRTKRLLV